MFHIIEYLLFLFLILFVKIRNSCSINENVNVLGPGLQPDKIVMPARYFFVNFSNKSIYNANDLEIDIKASSVNGHCRIWVNKLKQNDGSVIIRYKIFEPCFELTIKISVKGNHIGRSPYFFPGPIYADQCNCPEQDINHWLQQYGCTGDYHKIYEDLKHFNEIDMHVTVPKIVKAYHKPESTSFCHYIVKDNKIFRKCYGKHVGFNMFADNILLSLARKVMLPNFEFVVNLGDWPLVQKKGDLLPIFSWCGSEDTHDIVMPTYDITESTLENMGRVTLDILSVQGNVAHDWSDRESRAFWRGRDSRMERLKLIEIARANPDLINASLTNFFFFRDKEAEYGPKQPYVSFYKFFDYKYQVNIDGTVASYRLPYLLAGGGLVLKQESPYYEHFYSDLKEWTHYVPVKRDLSDFVSKVKWARDNDHEAMTIAKNAQRFANDNLLPQHIICYHAVLFLEWSKRTRGEVVVTDAMTLVPQPQFPCQCHMRTRDKDEL